VTCVAAAFAVVVAACTPSTDDVATSAPTQPTPTSTTKPPTPPTSAASPIPPPEPLLEFETLTPELVAPGEAVPVSEGVDSVRLLGGGLDRELNVEDGRVTLPEEVAGEVLLLERDGATITPRPLFAAEGDGIWLVASHQHLTPGDVASLWILERGAPDAQVLLVVDGVDEMLPLGVSAEGLLTPGLATATPAGELAGRPVLVPWDTIDELAPSGTVDITAISDATDIGVEPVNLGSCTAPATVEGSLGGPGEVRLVSLAPSGRTGSVKTPDGSFRFTVPPGPVFGSARLEDGTVVDIPPMVLGCGDTATVGSPVVGTPTELDLAQVTVDPLGRVGPWRPCRTAFISGEEATRAALALDRLLGLDVLTDVDLDRALTMVTAGDLGPYEMVAGLAARSMSRRFDVRAEPSAWIAQPTFAGDLPVSGTSFDQAAGLMRTAALCVTPQPTIADPGEATAVEVDVTGLDLEPVTATARLVDPDSSQIISEAATDVDGLAALAWTAPPEAGIVPLHIEVDTAPGAGTGQAAFRTVSLSPSIGVADRVSTSAVVGGIWAVQGSNWQQFSDEALFLAGLSFGGAVLACTAGPAVTGPWYGAVWLSTGGLVTIGAAFIDLGRILLGDQTEESLQDAGERVVVLPFVGFIPKGLSEDGPPSAGSERLSYWEQLLFAQATEQPPPPLRPPEDTLIELFTVPFSGVMVDTSPEEFVGSGPVPLVALVSRPRIPIERINGKIEFGPLLTAYPTATLRGPGGTITRARLVWRETCPLAPATVAEAADRFDELGNPFGG